ncbi:MAG TPA: ABC transporter substrate binding protein [Thiobacillus sp.]|nr:ABC transporter substrate binding protein [Thiobacillus sp.]
MKLTDGVSRRRTALQRIVRLGLACACLLLVSAPAVAARVTVVLSDDSASYQEVYQVIRAYLDDTSHEVIRVYAKRLNAVSLNESRLAVAVGVRAAESLAALPVRPPVLAVLVPRVWYAKIGRTRLSGGGRSASAIYLDQPFERQVRLIRQAFPEVRRVGMLVSAEQSGLVGELDEALQAQRLSLVHVTLSGEERLITALENVLSDAELLLAVPDPLIFNRNTAQSLFLTSYRYHVPVLGYSHSLTRAGALLSLHSSPAQIGRQTAEWVKGTIQDTPVNLPPPAHPAYFSISINEQVARSLGFTLPPEAELERRLGEGY